jgi:hypothetical protein
MLPEAREENSVLEISTFCLRLSRPMAQARAPRIEAVTPNRSSALARRRALTQGHDCKWYVHRAGQSGYARPGAAIASRSSTNGKALRLSPCSRFGPTTASTILDIRLR